MTARLRAPLLYLVTSRHHTAGRPLTSVVAAAVEGFRRTGAPAGAFAVQLREKDLPTRELLALGRSLREITAGAGVPLFVNDRADLALAVGADGVHLGGGALAPADVAQISMGLAVAISTHHASEIAAHVGPGGDNVAFAVFGPVFDTPTKRSFGPPQGLAALAAAASTPLPVLAIGGVVPALAADIVRAGAAGAACIRAVLAAPDPAETTFEFVSALVGARALGTGATPSKHRVEP